MKKLIKTIYILGLLFWGSFFIYGIAMLLVYNGFGNYYSFTCLNVDNFEISEDANHNLKITYSYNVDDKTYCNNERIAGELFYSKVGKKTELAICYNNTYPNVSYIKGLNLSVNREKVGVFISLAFLLFISAINLFAKRKYWIKKYRTFFEKLSPAPPDMKP